MNTEIAEALSTLADLALPDEPRFVIFDYWRDKAGKWQKVPLADATQNCDVPLERCVREYSRENKRGVGLVAGSAGLAAIDVDDGARDADHVGAVLKSVLGASPLAVTKSITRGRFHAWYRLDPASRVKARDWACDGLSGQIRGPTGWIALWQPVALAKAVRGGFRAASPVDPDMLPRPDASADSDTWHEGNRNSSLNADAFRAFARGDMEAVEAATDKARASGLDETEIAATLGSAKEAGGRDYAALVGAFDPAPEGEPEPVKVFDRKDATALRQALDALGVRVRFNLRWARVEASRDGAPWREMTDRQEDRLKQRIERQFRYRTTRAPAPLHFGRESWTECLNALLASREHDPFRERLASLPAWDGRKRLDGLLRRYFTVEDDGPLASWAGRVVFLGAVWRTFQPGYELHETPVLSGPQDIGKSSFLKATLWADMSDAFTDALDLSASGKVRVEALQGRVIVEIAEMRGVSKADSTDIKAFLSRRDDGGVRLAYRRNPETALRRCVIVGSTNDREPLPNDPSGNRRFVIIRLSGGDPAALRAGMATDRDMLWAEALARYRNGEHARLPDDLKPLQAAANESARARNATVEDALDTHLPKTVEGFTLREIMLEMMLPTSMQQGVIAALRVRGYQTARERRSDRARVMAWRKA